MAIRMSAQITGGERAVGRLDKMIERAADLSRPMGLLCMQLVRKTARILRSGERGVKSRSNDLADSLTDKVQGNEGSVGSNRAYARFQQQGGINESTRPGGFLSLPIADNLRTVNPVYPRPRDVPNGFFIRTGPMDSILLLVSQRDKKAKRGGKKSRSKLVVAAAEALRGTLQVWFLLVKQVRGVAHNYCTFDPPDQAYWDVVSKRWIERGV